MAGDFIVPANPDAASQILTPILRGTWDDSREAATWNSVLEAARLERIVPLVYDSVRRSGRLSQVPPSVLAQFTANYYETQATNILLLDKALGDALARLSAAKVPVIVLKGAALAELVYGDIGLRPMGDLDLLVKPGDAERAIRILLDAGYRRAKGAELRPGFDREFRVETELLAPAPRSACVEIHWRLIGPVFACRHVDDAGVWERAAPTTLARQSAYVLGPEDWVLHQAAHAVYKHRRITLLDLCDVDRLIRYLEMRLDWNILLKIGEQSRWLPALSAVLSQAVSLLDTPAPEWVLQRAKDYRLPWADRWLMRWWLSPGRPERHHVIPDWLTLPSPGARARLIWAYLVPSREYIEAHYSEKATWLPFLYLRRLWREAGSSLT